MSNAEAKRLEPRFTEAGEPARRERDIYGLLNTKRIFESHKS
jgi:hypothetical protein